MRITRTEKGELWSRDSTQSYTQSYVRVYTQPIHRYLVAWLYHHVWEKLTWRILRMVENIKRRYRPPTTWMWIPYTNRQDIRCYHLSIKDNIEVSMTKGERQPREPGEW